MTVVELVATAGLGLVVVTVLVMFVRARPKQYPLQMTGDYGTFVSITPYGTFVVFKARRGWLVLDSTSSPVVPVRVRSRGAARRLVAQLAARERTRRNMLPG